MVYESAVQEAEDWVGGWIIESGGDSCQSIYLSSRGGSTVELEG
jgi:hypothetical protein